MFFISGPLPLHWEASGPRKSLLSRQAALPPDLERKEKRRAGKGRDAGTTKGRD